MAQLIDARLWVNFIRDAPLRNYTGSSPNRRTIRNATGAIDPASVWIDAAALGQACRRNGWTPGSLDLLIAVVALHHDVELLTFDGDFEQIATVSQLRVKRLHWP